MKELQAFKDDILNDLDDLCSEVESSHVVNIPKEQLDDVVDIVVNEHRIKQEQLAVAYQNEDDEGQSMMMIEEQK